MKIETKYLMWGALALGVAYMVLEARKNSGLGRLEHAEGVANRAIDFVVPMVVKANPIVTMAVTHGLKNLVANALLKGKR